MIAKTLFLAETFHRLERNSFRDHESRAAEYPGGYLSEGGRLVRTSHAGPARHCRTVINPRSGKTLLFLVPWSNNQYLADLLPNNEIHPLEASHFAWEEASQEFGRLVADWISGRYRRVAG